MGGYKKGIFNPYEDRSLKKCKLTVLLENGTRVTVKSGGRVPQGPRRVRVECRDLNRNVEESFKDCEDSYEGEENG